MPLSPPPLHKTLPLSPKVPLVVAVGGLQDTPLPHMVPMVPLGVEVERVWRVGGAMEAMVVDMDTKIKLMNFPNQWTLVRYN